MRIIYDAYGQMGNRLWQYVDQVAWAMKHGKRVVSLFWDPSLDDFHNLRNNPYISFPTYFKVLRRGKTGSFYYRLLGKLSRNEQLKRIFASPFFQRRGFIRGEDIIFEDNHYHDVWNEERTIFAPSKDVTERIDREFLRCRHDNSSRIVGVHIRKGDYKTYRDGFYYYDDEEYADFMRQMVDIHGSDTRFFIASNEKISKDIFSNFHIIDINNTKAVEDMYALSKCDYIMGPFSTFSGWASFYGQVPYYYFRRNAEIRLSDFLIVRNMTRPPQ